MEAKKHNLVTCIEKIINEYTNIKVKPTENKLRERKIECFEHLVNTSSYLQLKVSCIAKAISRRSLVGSE